MVVVRPTPPHHSTIRTTWGSLWGGGGGGGVDITPYSPCHPEKMNKYLIMSMSNYINNETILISEGSKTNCLFTSRFKI